MSENARATALFRPGLVLVLVLLSAFAFSAFMALAAFAPDLRDKANGGRHAWSKSAIGYSALAGLLKADGQVVMKARDTEADRKRNDLTILTPNAFSRVAQMDSLMKRRTLVVLPKWSAQPDRVRRDWVVGHGMASPKPLRERAEKWLVSHLPEDKDRKRKPLVIARVHSPISERQTKWIEARQKGIAERREQEAERKAKQAEKETQKNKGRAADKPETDTKPKSAPEPDPYFHADGSPRTPQEVWELQNNAILAPIDAWHLSGAMADRTFHPGRIDNLQTMTWEELDPVIANGDQILLGKLRHTKKGEDIYVLADPDLLNNMGVLGSQDTMRSALAMLHAISTPDGAYVFDMTLHGFSKNLNLLKTLLMPPFLGVTLCALAAALLMAWSAWHRFGPAKPAVPPFAAGKRELVENSAALIRLANRESGMLPGYADLIREMAARDAGLPKGMNRNDMEALLARMGENAGVQTNLHALLQQSSNSYLDREEILRISRRLAQWRMELKQ